MSGRIFALIAALLIATAAYAETLVVYPFDSRDSFLGGLIADRVATAFAEDFEVYGPAVAPSLVPPLPVGEGFLNPTEFLQAGGVANRVGSTLLRDSLGAQAVLTGTIEFESDRLSARLFLATGEGSGRGHGLTAYRVTAPAGDPGRLASRIVGATALRLGIDSPRPAIDIDLSGADGELAQAITLVAAGLTQDARRALESLEDPGQRAAELLEAIRQVERGDQGADPALLATLALNRQPLDERLALRYFEQFAARSDLPAAALWTAVLETSINDLAAAEADFAALPAEYSYGRAARAAFLMGGGGEGARAPLEAALESEDVAALLAVAAVANDAGDLDLEKQALSRLGRVAPFFSYPFERLSFIAFDEEDALAAAEALAVAVELEPDSDLYWTNLGWAYYLLGMLEKSEAASIRALELDPAQYIASYNLGLVRAVTGRLSEASETYLEALRVDPEVDDAAIDDLEQALELYPDEPAVHYALAVLYEAEGRRSDAAEQYRQFLERGDEGPFRDRARERVEVLSAPPPPIEITDGLVSITLGRREVAAAPYHPGDPLYPSFEVYTPGDELPQRLDVTLELLSPQGGEVTSLQQLVEVPGGAIGLVVDEIELALPADLSPGVYRLDVNVGADGDRQASGSVMFEVTGQPQLLRQLLGRNLLMQSLDTGVLLYRPEDLSRPDLLIEVLLSELQVGADVAEQVLPEVEGGRFEGMSGGEVFRASTANDVTDFLNYLIASGARDTSFVFAEAYAQWALEGAPAGAEEPAGE